MMHSNLYIPRYLDQYWAEPIPQHVLGAHSASFALGSGLIHRTFLLGNHDQTPSWVLQCLNTQVFTDVDAIAHNQEIIAQHLQHTAPDYRYMQAVKGKNGRILQEVEGNIWRLFPYISDAVALDFPPTADCAFETASAFGQFALHLNACPQSGLRQTIPDFHHISKYANALQLALAQAPAQTLTQAKPILDWLNLEAEVMRLAIEIQTSQAFRLRVLHHDAKMSNVLLHTHTLKPLFIIDLDTVMPGKIFSDLGDLIRSSAFSISEADAGILAELELRRDVLQAIQEGYMSKVADMLNSAERQFLKKSTTTGNIMLYMQTIRFVTDFLNGNTYYQTTYATQNLDRAKVQIEMFKQL